MKHKKAYLKQTQDQHLNADYSQMCLINLMSEGLWDQKHSGLETELWNPGMLQSF